MESLQMIERLEIESNKIFYDKKTEILSVYLPEFVFIGNYKKSARIKKILDDIFNSLKNVRLVRENLLFVDFITLRPLPDNTKLKQLKLISKKEKEEQRIQKEEKKSKQALIPIKEESKISKSKRKKAMRSDKIPAPKALKSLEPEEKTYEREDLLYEEEEEMEMLKSEVLLSDDVEKKKDEDVRAAPPPPPSMAPSAPAAGPAGPPGGGMPAREIVRVKEREEIMVEEPKPTIYEINMGLQYYSVMMEQNSYLFYVYLSHKELKIVDEEGKTIFETSFKVVTTKKEPPILNLRVEGEGFEVHPLYGKVEVKKDAVNPPVMIFSVLALKNKNRSKKEKKEGERRFLHVYVDFEEKVINHSILSIIVQPKHFRLEIGPFHLNVSKKAAMIISFLSIVIAGVSLIYTIFSIDPSSTFTDILSNFAPGLGSIAFIAIFLITLFKEGIYPLKEKISYFLNFDKQGMLIK
jgi:hypothetical protein